MADNRLYIYDKDTNLAVGIAKSYGRWYVSELFCKNNNLAKSLNKFFESLEENKGFGEEGTKLKLITEGELPKDTEVISLIEKEENAQSNIQKRDELKEELTAVIDKFHSANPDLLISFIELEISEYSNGRKEITNVTPEIIIQRI